MSARCPFRHEPDELLLYAPLNAFLVHLARGWRLAFVVDALPGNHGRYSLLLWRPA